MGFLGGDSSSSSTSMQVDQRQVVDGRGLAIEANTGNQTLTYTVNESSKEALVLADKAVSAVVSGAAGIVASSSGTMRDFLAATTRITDESSYRVASAAQVALMAGDAAGARAAQSARDAISATQRMAEEAATAVRQASQDALTAVRGSQQDAMTLAARTNDQLHSTAADSLGLISSVVDRAFENSRDIERLSIATVQNVADAYQTARTTETTAQFQDYRYLMIAAMAVVGLVAVQKMRH